MCLFSICAERDVLMKSVLLAVALLTARLACGADADCYSTNGTSLRESFRDDDIVMMGRIASVVQENYFTRRFNIEQTLVLKGSLSESTELVLQDFRQIETNVPEPIVGAEFLFTLRRVNKQPDEPERYMTINMDPHSSKVWDPLALDAFCTDWRELLGRWTTELNTALDLLPEYKAAWITVLSERAGLSEDELANRLIDVDVEILQWRNGFYFRSEYSVLIDWLETPQMSDQFTIFDYYRPRDSLGPNKWATIDEIRNMKSPGVQPRIPTQIAFRSEDELSELVFSVTGKSDLVLTYEYKKTLRAWSVFDVDAASNICSTFEVDLESGDTRLVEDTVCIVTVTSH